MPEMKIGGKVLDNVDSFTNLDVAVLPLPKVLIRFPTASLRQVLPMVDCTSECGMKGA